MKTLQLKQDFYWAGILDKNLRVFDIIMYTEFGTTYNSYILKAGDETILFETAKEKFFGDYRAALSEQLDIAQIDYIVVDIPSRIMPVPSPISLQKTLRRKSSQPLRQSAF